VILVEQSYWPLVVVGALEEPLSAETRVDSDESGLWASDDLRLAVVIPGDLTRACSAQAEVFDWLECHREALWRCASRVAWIFENEALRRSAERWLALAGDRLFRDEVLTFRNVRSAVVWLSSDATLMRN